MNIKASVLLFAFGLFISWRCDVSALRCYEYINPEAGIHLDREKKLEFHRLESKTIEQAMQQRSLIKVASETKVKDHHYHPELTPKDCVACYHAWWHYSRLFGAYQEYQCITDINDKYGISLSCNKRDVFKTLKGVDKEVESDQILCKTDYCNAPCDVLHEHGLISADGTSWTSDKEVGYDIMGKDGGSNSNPGSNTGGANGPNTGGANGPSNTGGANSPASNSVSYNADKTQLLFGVATVMAINVAIS